MGRLSRCALDLDGVWAKEAPRSIEIDTRFQKSEGEGLLGFFLWFGKGGGVGGDGDDAGGGVGLDGGEGGGDVFGELADGLEVEVGVAFGGAGGGVAQGASDDGEGGAEGASGGGEGVAEVVDADVGGDACGGEDASPGFLRGAHGGVGIVAGLENPEGLATEGQEAAQLVEGCGGEDDGFRAGFGVGEVEEGGLPVDHGPLGEADFAGAGAGEHEDAEKDGGTDGDPAGGVFGGAGGTAAGSAGGGAGQ